MSKPATLAPAYACIYPGLAEIARRHGYALAIHGSLQNDLDLVAIPWTEKASDAETLVNAVMVVAGAYIDLSVLPLQTAHAGLARIKRELFQIHRQHVVSDKTRKLMDDARELVCMAMREIEFEKEAAK